MAKFSISSKNGTTSLTEEFLLKLEKIRAKSESMYAPFLNEEFTEIYFHSVDNFILQGLLERYHGLREQGLSRKDICKKIGIEYDESFYLTGDITKNILREECGSLDHLLENEVFGVVNPNGKNKKRIRESFPELIEKYLIKDQEVKLISYAGLENVNFRSYITLARNVRGFSTDRSLIIEANLRNYNIMNSIKRHASIWGEEGINLFEKLTIENGLMSDVFKDLYYDTHRFNVLNLDFDGQFSPNKELTFRLLFNNSLISPPALLFVTLNNNESKRQWVRQWYRKDTIEQENLLDKCVEDKCVRIYGEKNKVNLIYREFYTDTSDMIFSAYHIK